MLVANKAEKRRTQQTPQWRQLCLEKKGWLSAYTARHAAVSLPTPPVTPRPATMASQQNGANMLLAHYAIRHNNRDGHSHRHAVVEASKYVKQATPVSQPI